MPAGAFLLLPDNSKQQGSRFVGCNLQFQKVRTILEPVRILYSFLKHLFSMFFSRKFRYTSTLSAPEMRSKLLGQHMNVHNLDFEVQEKNTNVLRIVPHAEQITEVKTLPITHVAFKPGGGTGKTQVIISAHMRRIDSGGPMLVVIFCVFMLIAAALGHFLSSEDYDSYTLPLFGLGVLIFTIMWVRLESGYFDYVRKIRDHIKQQIIV